MIELGLQRISKLLSDTPLPWRAIHVAGTNGKGSVCSYISEMLNAYNRSGHRKHRKQDCIRHGRFTSPHLIDRWDCIQMNVADQMQVIPTSVFLATEKAVRHRNHRENINASEFELLTATAFECFTRSHLDIGVVEVAITRIGKDHQQFLGDTYAKIAFEKAGIIKPGVPLTYYQQQDAPEIIHVIVQRAQQLRAPIILPHQLPERLPEETTTDYKELQHLHDEMKSVVRDYVFPGRQERISLAALTGYTGEVLLDGAHNQQGIELLGQVVDSLRGADQSKPIIYVTAISNSPERKVEDILKPLLRSGDSILAVEFGPVAGMPWVEPRLSTDVIRIAEESGTKLNVCRAYGRDIAKALQHACRSAEQQLGSHIVICGSLYLAGEVHRLLRDARR
ncbi:uncharacterized protein MYCFIDRAFT_84150 [Pseudocercospora fijiensis CIRAD86]|uniref:Mur ligase central domain-containing protein n=1 Tax=Pseudocercospora fijiensis (strain CIRAD86) TaxID=383855 RepID=M3B388_PSEFD|nr:uncharacterized protein MYCFIDRAFT_84150 [Pseudocercospora fijiensis CIRAD86]EME83848.1 hypothetical protein MYCFIDRAFT_84150 [Pseudocercospora fijiensis CIRAD86]